VPSTASRTFSKTPAIVGGIFGGVISILAFIVIFVRLRRRRTYQLQEIDRTGHIEPWVPVTNQSAPPMPTTEFSKRIRMSTRTPSRHKPVILSCDHQPTVPTRESVNPGSNLAEALDAVSRLHPNADQRDILVNALNALNAPPTPSTSLPTVPQMQSTSAPPQDGESQLMTALNSFSRLTTEEKHTVVSMLSTLIATDGLRTRRGDSIARAPPPYSD
jgi:hypothetical protein